jgi:hypothetical protein
MYLGKYIFNHLTTINWIFKINEKCCHLRVFFTLYKFIGVPLQYKSAIMNQLYIHDFYSIFLFSRPNHFYVIYIIIQNEKNLIDTIYNYSFA